MARARALFDYDNGASGKVGALLTRAPLLLEWRENYSVLRAGSAATTGKRQPSNPIITLFKSVIAFVITTNPLIGGGDQNIIRALPD